MQLPVLPSFTPKGAPLPHSSTPTEDTTFTFFFVAYLYIRHKAIKKVKFTGLDRALVSLEEVPLSRWNAKNWEGSRVGEK